MICLFFAAFPSFSKQDEPYYEEEPIDTFAVKPRFGGYLHYGITDFITSFSKLPGIPNCCPEFTEGYGNGISFGGLFNYHFTPQFFASARLGYSSYKGLLSSNQSEFIIIDGKSSIGKFQHTIDAVFGSVNLEPYAGYYFFDKLAIQLGLRAGFNIYSNYIQKEEIIEPADRGTFIDGTRIRNYSEGSIPDVTFLQLSLAAGISYELPLNKNGSLSVAPEFFYYFGFTNQVSNLIWKVNSFRFGVSVKYKEPPPPPPPPPAPPDPFDPDYPEPPKPPAISAYANLVMVDSARNEKKNFNVRIEDFISLNMRPLLTFVFFDENSASIPKRYIKISPKDTVNFTYKNLQNLDAMQTYYQVLNILGKRLKDHPNKEITIVGSNSNLGEEKNNKDLSMQRAVAVRDYLKYIWGVPEKQMTIEARNLPKEPSNNDEPGGIEENRRVEIIAKENVITEPVITIDTLRKISSYNLRFYPKIKAEAGLDSWSLVVKQGSRELIKWKGGKQFPEQLDWLVTQEDSSAPKRGGLISYTLTARDLLGQIAVSPIATIPVDQFSIDRKRLERIADKEFEYYSLILFDYGKSELGAEHKSVLDFVKNRITPQSQIIVTGHSDSMGDEKINKKISESRARAAARRLDISNAQVVGMGESDLLYDNTLPEGRFYCRTVKITIETPVKE